MADFFDVSAAIVARLRASWTATPAERLRFEDEPDIDMTVLAPFCQGEVVADVDVPYIGAPANRLSRIDGVLMLHLMTPIGDTSGAIRSMYRNARAVLVNQSWTSTADGAEFGVYMQGISPNGGRPSDEDGAYRGMTASIPFFALYRETP